MRNPILDIFHNLYGIFFCFYAIYKSYPILTENLDSYDYTNDYNDIFFHSSAYFLVSGLINIYDRNSLFLIHHIISWSMIYYGIVYPSDDYVLWACLNFLSEISTIFLSSEIILKALSNYYPINPKYNFICKTIFLITYTIVRIFYLFPTNVKFLLTYNFHGPFRLLLYVGSWFMVGLNLYWFVEILKKTYKTLYPKNNKSNEIKSE